jgi:transposase
MSAPEQPSPSYEELAGLIAGLVARVQTLEAENAKLKRRLGMNSTNSSTPPSTGSLAVKAGRQAQSSSRQRSIERKPGGQKRPKGSGLMPSAKPTRTEPVPAG